MPDQNNRTVLKFVSLEMLISLAISLVALTGAWYTLAADNDANKTQIVSIKQEQKEIKDAVQGIRVDVATIRANQEAQKDGLRKQAKDIDRILDILERRDR